MVSDILVIYVITGVGLVTYGRKLSVVYGDLGLAIWAITGFYFSYVSGGTYDPLIPAVLSILVLGFVIADLLTSAYRNMDGQ